MPHRKVTKNWWLENITKGRIAETLVNELLRRAGFRVYRFGYEAVLQNLTQTEHNILRGEDDVVRQIRSIPDFLVVKSKPLFVEVKFKSRWKLSLDENAVEDRDILLQLDRIAHFWKAKVIFITTEQPYFRVSGPPYHDGKKIIFADLVTDQDFEIPCGTFAEFNDLVRKYLGGK